MNNLKFEYFKKSVEEIKNDFGLKNQEIRVLKTKIREVEQIKQLQETDFMNSFLQQEKNIIHLKEKNANIRSKFNFGMWFSKVKKAFF